MNSLLVESQTREQADGDIVASLNCYAASVPVGIDVAASLAEFTRTVHALSRPPPSTAGATAAETSAASTTACSEAPTGVDWKGGECKPSDTAPKGA